MNYANLDNHNHQALLDYANPIARQISPAIAVFGFLSLLPTLRLKEVFEDGILEFIAVMTLPFSLGCAILFLGLSLILVNRYPRLHSFSQRCSGYWASFCISLCAATLGVVAGLFVPYICANGIQAAFVFLCLGLISAGGYGILAHYVGTWTFSESVGQGSNYPRWFCMVIIVVGFSFMIAAVYNKLIKINAI